MNLHPLILAFRGKTRDVKDPPFWSDEEIIAWLEEAQREAAIRGRLLQEAQTFHLEGCEDGLFDRPASIYEITHAAAKLNERGWVPLILVSSERLDGISPDWRRAHGEPRWLIQYDNALRLAPRQDKETKVRLEGFRLPRPIMETGEPEINPAHHEKLLDWVFARAYRVNDADMFDPEAAERHEAAFNRYFGLPVDSDLRRKTREDAPHHNEAFWV